MRVARPPEEGMVFLALKTSVQRRILMLLMKQPEDVNSEAEVGAPPEVSTPRRMGGGWVAVNAPGIVGERGVVWFRCAGGRKGLLPTPDEFPRFEGGRKADSWDGTREPGEDDQPLTVCLRTLHLLSAWGGLSARPSRAALYHRSLSAEADGEKSAFSWARHKWICPVENCTNSSLRCFIFGKYS